MEKEYLLPGNLPNFLPTYVIIMQISICSDNYIAMA